MQRQPVEGRTARGMARALFAALVGLVGFVAYVGLVLRAGDWVNNWHWLVQFVFYALAGLVWVWPVRRLMVWAARPG